jgi:fumarate reductase flavoprotein subunit
VLQIYHGGRMSEPKLIGGQTPVAPSALAAPRDGAATPVALTAEEVDDMITKFGEGVNVVPSKPVSTAWKSTAQTPISFSSSSHRTPTSAMTNGAADRENRARFPLAILDITHSMAQIRRFFFHHRLSFLAGRAGRAGHSFRRHDVSAGATRGARS